jgi:hypothetical protein
VNLLKYLKAAFLYPWNLLAFAGASGFALLSGHPDVFLPIVFAGEAAYLGFLGTHPKFRAYVEAQQAKAARAKQSATAEQALERILSSLSPKAVQRFEALRQRCLELRQIAVNLKDPGSATPDMPLDELQLAGLDRLLWTFLRLLFTQQMLERFFKRTNEAQITGTIENLEQSLKQLADGPDDPQKQKIRKALEDNLQTSHERLDNLKKARDNSELVRLEIDRLESKIQSLSEMAVNRQEPDYIAHQVDEVAAGMRQTERTMNELQFATGLAVEEEVPQLVQREAIKIGK